MLHLIYGNDQLARKEAFDALRESLDTDGSLATNTAWFDAKTANPQEVIAACDTVPFLAEVRLVVLEGALPKPGKRKKPAEEDGDDEEDGPGKWEPLIDYAPRLPPTTTLVLLDGGILTTSALFKALKPHAEVTNCPLPGDSQMAGWVADRAKSMGLKLDAAAAKLLADLIGADPWLLKNEMDKLLAYSGGEVVRADDVRELVSRAKEHMGWELRGAVIGGNGATAARLLQELRADGAVAAVLLSTIAGGYRRIAIARDMIARGESGSAIMKTLGVSERALYHLREEVDRISEAAVLDAYARLIEAELDLKRRGMDDDMALELAVQDLASRPQGRAPARSR